MALEPGLRAADARDVAVVNATLGICEINYEYLHLHFPECINWRAADSMAQYRIVRESNPHAARPRRRLSEMGGGENIFGIYVADGEARMRAWFLIRKSSVTRPGWPMVKHIEGTTQIWAGPLYFQFGRGH